MPTRRLFACVVTAVAFTVACSPARSEVVFWQFWPAEVVRPILDGFEREQPRLRVRLERLSWDTGLDTITAAMASGDVPDLCELGSTWMPRLLRSGGLADWTSGSADLRARLNGWEMCTRGGRTYGIPWVLGTRALFYNKTLLARAGLDSTRAPLTWAELYEASAAVQRLGHGIHGYGVQQGQRSILFKKFMPFAWGNGGQILSDDLRSAVFDSPENRQALEFYLSLRSVGLLERQEVLDREFREGRLGMQISGAWPLRSIPGKAAVLRYGVSLVPRPDVDHGTHASFAGAEVLVSFKGCRQEAAALRLARYLVRPENAAALARATRSVEPATVGADTMAYYRDHPDERVMVKQLETAFFPPNHPAWMDMEIAIEDEIEQALLDRKPPAQALSDAQRKLTELLADASGPKPTRHR